MGVAAPGVWLLVSASALAACAPLTPRVLSPRDAAPSPGALWTPPKSNLPAPPAAAPLDLPADLEGRRWGLPDVLDVALRNSPSTRVSWQTARASLARYGVERAAYLPQLGLDAVAATRYTHNDRTDRESDQSSFGPSARLTWTLLDFGSRAGALDQARQSLLAANWGHNRAVQDLVLQVQRAYYNYLAVKALREARAASLKSAEVNLDAARGRHQAGVATIADVLQARTAAARARLALQTVQGAIETTRGALAASMGLPADLAFDVEDLPRDLSVRGLDQKVGDLIRAALDGRPDLAAARAQAEAAVAQARKVRGEGLPTLGFVGSAGTTWFDADGGSDGAGNHREDSYFGSLVLRFPLFTGYAQTYSERRAEAEAEAAAEQARSLEQQAILQVFTAYQALETSTHKVTVAEDLIAAAEQSEAVALGRYREGVGTILDLTTAQGDLSEARGQRIQSYWEWYTALAQLAHDTGLLGLRGETPLDPRGAADSGPGGAPTTPARKLSTPKE